MQGDVRPEKSRVGSLPARGRAMCQDDRTVADLDKKTRQEEK